MRKDISEQQSGFFRTPEEHIRRWQSFAEPKNFNFEITDSWMAPAALYVREIIHKLGLEKDPRVIEADKKILKLSFEYTPAFTEEPDIGYKPEPHWWWYFLRKIQEGDYPLDLLPDHLKDIYRDHLKKLGKLT